MVGFSLSRVIDVLMASDYNVVTRLQKSSIIFQEKGGYTIGTNLNSKLYKEIVERIIEPGLNKFEAKMIGPNP